MPLISSFYGMYIKMYFQRKEHNPPHFHVIYGEYTGEIEIKSLKMREGDLPPNALELVKEWATLHQTALMHIWETQEFIKLPPVNVPPPTEAGASCFNENSTAAPRNCCGLHSLHRRRFPCDPRYFMRYVRQIFA